MLLPDAREPVQKEPMELLMGPLLELPAWLPLVFLQRLSWLLPF